MLRRASPGRVPRDRGGILVGPAAAAGIAYAFQIGGYVAIATCVAAVALRPAAKTFLPKLRLNPQAAAAH